jgi:hypothetical protein
MAIRLHPGTTAPEDTAPEGAPEGGRPNPAFWAMIGIPAATILASAATLFLAYGGAEPPLPARYAWEGAALDHDLARSERARALGLGVTLDLAADGRIVAQVTRRDPAATAADGTHAAGLRLHLTHATRPEADRSLTLRPSGAQGRYEGRTDKLPAARWLLQLDGDTWQLRGRLETPAASVRLGH